MILIVSTAHDPHCDIVTRELEKLEAPFVRFNTEDFPTRAQVQVHIQDGVLSGRLVLKDIDIDISSITSIWYRRPEPPVISPAITDPGARSIAEAEARSLLRQLWACLADRFWMSWPMNIRRADQKLLQLRLAARLGFSVPNTLISQDPSRVRQFFEENSRTLALKTVSGVVIEGPPIRAVYTARLCDNDLARIDDVALCPTLFQMYVDKSSELRITVVGERVFAAEMYTQCDPKTSIDWRRGSPLRVPHKAVSLPHQMECQCLALVRSLGLAFGAIDMIKKPSGELMFLEINPNGQWAWIEGLTGLPIARTIAESLANPPSCRVHGVPAL